MFAADSTILIEKIRNALKELVWENVKDAPAIYQKVSQLIHK
jgi:hypothetical protein